jgi:hypothetical protein
LPQREKAAFGRLFFAFAGLSKISNIGRNFFRFKIWPKTRILHFSSEDIAKLANQPIEIIEYYLGEYDADRNRQTR